MSSRHSLVFPNDRLNENVIESTIPVTKISRPSIPIVVANSAFIAYTSSKAGVIRIISQRDASHVSVSPRVPAQIVDLTMSTVEDDTYLAALAAPDDGSGALLCRWKINNERLFEDDVLGDEMYLDEPMDRIKYFPSSDRLVGSHVNCRDILTIDGRPYCNDAQAKLSLVRKGLYYDFCGVQTGVRANEKKGFTVSLIVDGEVYLRSSKVKGEQKVPGCGADYGSAVLVDRNVVVYEKGVQLVNFQNSVSFAEGHFGIPFGSDLKVSTCESLVVVADGDNKRLLVIDRAKEHIKAAVYSLADGIDILSLATTRNLEQLDGVLCDVYVFHSKGVCIVQVEDKLQELPPAPEPEPEPAPTADSNGSVTSSADTEPVTAVDKSSSLVTSTPKAQSPSRNSRKSSRKASREASQARESPRRQSPQTQSNQKSASPEPTANAEIKLDSSTVDRLVEIAREKLVQSGEFVTREQFEASQQQHKQWVDKASKKFEALLDRFEKVLNERASVSQPARGSPHHYDGLWQRDSIWSPFSAEEEWSKQTPGQGTTLGSLGSAMPQPIGKLSQMSPGHSPSARSPALGTVASPKSPGVIGSRKTSTTEPQAPQALQTPQPQTPHIPRAPQGQEFDRFERAIKDLTAAAGSEEFVSKFKELDSIDPNAIVFEEKGKENRQLVLLAAISVISLSLRNKTLKGRAVQWIKSLTGRINVKQVGPHSRLIVSALNRVLQGIDDEELREKIENLVLEI